MYRERKKRKYWANEDKKKSTGDKWEGEKWTQRPRETSETLGVMETEKHRNILQRNNKKRQHTERGAKIR
jgi:hypothetical protein